MTSISDLSRKTLLSMLVLSGLLLVTAVSGSNTEKETLNAVNYRATGQSVAGAGMWMKTAPVTWSSRAATRWTARFETPQRYAV